MLAMSKYPEIDAVLAGDSEGCIVCGDCLDVLRELPDGCVDAVVTDPPYGIGFNFKAKRSRKTGLSFGAEHRQGDCDPKWENVVGDDKPFDPTPFLAFQEVVLWGAQNFASRLPDSRGWLIWDKLGDKAPCAFGDCELAWTNKNMSVRIHRQLWRGLVREGVENVVNGPKLHPCQKPLALMEWCVSFTKSPIILDPFCGSGTTCVAAKKLGRRYIGIEINERYCEIARNRLRDTPRPLFTEGIAP